MINAQKTLLLELVTDLIGNIDMGKESHKDVPESLRKLLYMLKLISMSEDYDILKQLNMDSNDEVLNYEELIKIIK